MMNDITLPDFEVMAQNLVIRYCCSMKPIEAGIAEELEAMFDQGYALGRRSCGCNEEWYTYQDEDEAWQAEFGVARSTVCRANNGTNWGDII